MKNQQLISMNSINKYKINLVLLYSFSFLWADCSSQKKEPVIQLNLKIVDSLFNMHGNNLALLHCTRCGCFENAYRVILQKGDKLNYVL